MARFPSSPTPFFPRLKTAALSLLAACTFTSSSYTRAADVIAADICVYGGTSGGVAAAVQASRMGKKAVIIEPGKHLGGMTSGGLSAVDIGDPRTVGGIAREYFTRLVASYGKTLAWDQPFVSKGGGPATGGAYSIEPHIAEKVFTDMAKEAKVPVHFNARLASAKKDGARITELTMEDGTVVRAKMFIDATYEGDLMARAKVSYTLMREGNAKYGETYNGIHYTEKYQPRTNHLKPGPSGRVPGGQGVWDRDLPLDPYVSPGEPRSGLLPLLNPGTPGTPGEPAPGVQAYCFRLCLTTAADRIPIIAPEGYDVKRYELVARFIAGCIAMGDDMDLRWFSKHDALPNDKWDFNTATFGGNMPGASWEWPEASYDRRVQIAKEHELYHRGLLYFLATDPRVPAKVREDMKRFGLPKDEFQDNGGWPHQLYIREARRMVSDLVMTEHHTFGREVAPNSVSLGSYGTDTHEIRRIVKDGVVIREGKTALGRDGAPPYPIGYGAIVPKQAECENLFVTFALSASHTAFSSIRMEPVFMISSQSAATAASYAIDDNVPVQKVDQAKLRTQLLKDKQILEWREKKVQADLDTPGAPKKTNKAETKSTSAPAPTAAPAVEPQGPDYVDQLAIQLKPTRKVAYKKLVSRDLMLHVFEPEGFKSADKRPCYIVIHGGGWRGGQASRMYPFAEHFAKLGMVGISVEYRLLGKEPANTVFDCVKDGRSAVRYVRAHASEFGIDPQKIVVSGGSAGGHVAVSTALFDDVNEEGEDTSVSSTPNALILLFPVIDTSAQGYGNAKIGARWKELSPADRVKPGGPPTITFHGTGDTVTPFAGAQRFHEEMLKAGNRSELVIHEGGAHGYLMRTAPLYDECMAKSEAFLRSLSFLK
ncbi:acetyl esterase/lipase [Roseimicrobium gellanilyticum]|uniref:Acetyl esterase/lipase n=1 Tax=Roseimicrobium gellanilyticum TaxID=748857 RepID=A0A366HPI1_9BACT|nr:FAD-dependent oxidoreductase [Roseimicrobium gellanilyticum]RBP44495.1 acetyl esterase/lipase [Roseimicrobium gellanilyticum]